MTQTPDMSEHHADRQADDRSDLHDAHDIDRRAELNPEEQAAGSDDAEAQAAAILADSEARMAESIAAVEGDLGDEEPISRSAGEGVTDGA